MMLRRWPVGFEILLAILRTKSGLMALYISLYFLYTSLSKLTTFLGSAVERLKTRVDPKLIESTDYGGWYKVAPTHRSHWYEADSGWSLCSRVFIDANEDKTPCETDKCRICKRKLNDG